MDFRVRLVRLTKWLDSSLRCTRSRGPSLRKPRNLGHPAGCARCRKGLPKRSLDATSKLVEPQFFLGTGIDVGWAAGALGLAGAPPGFPAGLGAAFGVVWGTGLAGAL